MTSIFCAPSDDLAFNTRRQLWLSRWQVLAVTIPYGSGSARVGRRLASALGLGLGLVLSLVESVNSVSYILVQGNQGFHSKSEQRTAIY